MEISKGLQEEIVLVQNKLKNAIRDHQIYVGQQKNDPNNADIVDGLRKITLHIVALGRWQKQVVQRLRKEVESYKAENALNGARISVASLLGLNNNNHITHNNESATTRRHNAETPEESKPLLNGHADSRASSKEDYEETVRNGDVASPLRDDASVKERLPSPVVPAPVENGAIAVNAAAAKPEKNGGEEKPKVTDKQQQFFMGRLGLITRARLVELQNKRAERKRRSTANSHFVYNNWEVPTKRRRHAYLQSLGSAPQTRQTTARLNGPSPPPKPYNKPGPKPGAAAAARSLIQASNKPGPKPAILRNGDGKQKEFFSGKIVKQETEKNSGNSSSSSSNGRDSEQRKSAQQTTSTGKAVHIPGLPSSLTIERIENDSSICVTCRNPGTLTVCEYCSAKFHVSCHTTSPGPTAKSFSTCYCPKCMASFRSQNILEKSIKKETEEKERVRYELRERNTDLRLQVYELEKRSQLISQSLQQQRTRRELLGKQEKTQRSIKRLVDFIKLMQRSRDDSSSPPRPSASTSCPPRPSSYRSPQPHLLPTTAAVSSPSLPSTSRSSSPLPLLSWDPQQQQRGSDMPSNSKSRLQSSSISSHSQVSPQPMETASQEYCAKLRISPQVNRSSLSTKSPDSVPASVVPDKVLADDGKQNQCSILMNGQMHPLPTPSPSRSPDSRSPSPATTSLLRSYTQTTTRTDPEPETKTHPTMSTLSWSLQDQSPFNSRSPKCLTSLLNPLKYQVSTSPINQQQSNISKPLPNHLAHQNLTRPAIEISNNNSRKIPHLMTAQQTTAPPVVTTMTMTTSSAQSSLAGMATKLMSSTSALPLLSSTSRSKILRLNQKSHRSPSPRMNSPST
ncbi:serine/arginine repetitive matrix protein 1 isoform X5 [Nasonia vitripennis]|uniref:PHD finger protein 21A n=1 Tax=Nasonia vitripennis TaxID=7425 RepID=A0A7M7T8H0_NASVI|nr:serine/arginine repetitive matrix protein 1 isoform X5 [Nasonia vitripennis]